MTRRREGPTFALRFPINDVPKWAARYGYLGPETARLETVVGPRSRVAGVITKPDFLDICEWKSPRQRPRYAENSAELIEAATRIALSARDERIRIGVLLVLRRVGWPVASTLLYFAHRDPTRSSISARCGHSGSIDRRSSTTSGTGGRTSRPADAPQKRPASACVRWIGLCGSTRRSTKVR